MSPVTHTYTIIVNSHTQEYTQFHSKWSDTHCYTHKHTQNCIHSHAPTTKHDYTFPASQLSHPQIAQSRTLAHGSHAQCACPPFRTPPRILGPRWILHSGSYLFPHGSPALVRGRSCSEASSRQRPAHGWPIPAGPTRKAEGRLRGAATGWVYALSAAGFTRDQQETAQDPALASPCDPALGQAGLAGRGMADSWWGKLGKFVLSADWSARGGALGGELGPTCPTPPWRKRITPTQP